MAIDYCRVDFDKLTANANIAQDRAVVPYEIRVTGTSDPRAAILEAVNADQLPKKFQRHPFNLWLFVDDILVQVKANSKGFEYEALVNYIGPSFESDVNSPLLIPPEVTWAFANGNEQVDSDIFNKPLVNPSGETFDPPIQKEVADTVLRVVRNEKFFNALVAADFMNSVNNDIFFGVGERQAKLNVFDGIRQRVGDFFYWQVTYEIQFRREIRPDGTIENWDRRILNEGFRTVNLDENDDPIKDANDVVQTTSTNTTSPVLLDLKGQRLGDNDPAVFLSFRLYKERPFSDLNLE